MKQEAQHMWNKARKYLILILCCGPLACASDEAAETATDIRCYKKTVGSGSETDVTLLTLTRQADQVEGRYYWLPAYKDRRMGDFKGHIAAEGFNVEYVYQQEGLEQTAQLFLRPETGLISVTGGDPALGMAATLPQVDCTNLSTPSPERF